MKKIAVAILVLWPHVALAQYNPPTYINPQPGGGYIITQPGAPYRPPVYVNPQFGGGYIATQPGARPYQAPIYINPQPNGGSVITQPGGGLPSCYETHTCQP